jgi:hypothetical protein
MRRDGDLGVQRQGQSEFTARWSADGQSLLWVATNKWGVANAQVVRIARGKLKAVDVRLPAVKRVLAAVKRASPAPYAASKRHAKGLGSWFRDGFAVDVRPAGAGPLTWRLVFTVDATSDHKCMYPAAERAGGTMSASLGADGAWTFGAFVPGHAGCGRDGLVCAFSDCE